MKTPNNNSCDIDLKINVNSLDQIKQDSKIKNSGAYIIFLPAFYFLSLILHFSILQNPDWLKISFGIVAIIHIFVYGFYAFKIHNIEESSFEKNKWYRYNQYWFNGLGAFLGWSVLYFILFFKLKIDDFSFLIQFFENVNLVWQDFVLILVSYFGITGHLPLVSLLQRLKK